MKEIHDIVRAYEEAIKAGKKAALATVVQVIGSSYRRPGARMLVTEDGQLTGAISGGCLEGDALRKAQLVMAQQHPMLVTYDTTDEEDAKLGVGLGCNGIIHILFEPIDATNNNNPLRLLTTVMHMRSNAVIVTLFSLPNRKLQQPGTCLLFTQYQEEQGNYPDRALHDLLVRDAADALRTQTSAIKTYPADGQLRALIELIKPPLPVFIFGAGNDVVPVVQLTALLGWHTTVIDGRSNYATPRRFPPAQQVLVLKPEAALSAISLNSRSVVLLMTHNYNYDIAVLKKIIQLPLLYIGALGPKKKLQRMLDELQQEGMQITHEQLQQVYGPAGLDVGAETPAEIALSIIAEIQAVLSKKSGASLREKTDAIHAGDL